MNPYTAGAPGETALDGGPLALPVTLQWFVRGRLDMTAVTWG